MGSQRLEVQPAAPAPPVSRPRRPISLRASIREVLGARELTNNLVRRDLKVRHRGTFLGMLWSLTTPLLIVALYYFVFTYILIQTPVKGANRPDGNPVPFAVFFFAGLIIWNLFSNSLSTSTTSVTSSGYLLRKVYFPRAILPLSAVLSGVVTFAFEAAVLVVAILVFVGWPNAQILWVPVIVALAVLLTYGLALFLSAVTVFLRDMAHFIAIILQLWFWGTPIIYTLQYVGDRPGFVRILKLNPMTGIVVSFRNVTVLNRAPDLSLLALDLAYAVVFLAVGAVVFHRSQRLFAEIV